MNSAQLDVTRGTRGEIAKLIGSPSWPAQEHYGCPGQSRQYIPITVTHPPPDSTTWTSTNQCTTQNIQMAPVLYHRYVVCHTMYHLPRYVVCHTMQHMPRYVVCHPTLTADSTTLADVTEHCGRFFGVFRIFHLLTSPPWGCHNACPNLYLILCLRLKVTAPPFSQNEWPLHYLQPKIGL